MKVRLIFQLDDTQRRAVALHFGRRKGRSRKGPAPVTRAEFIQFVQDLITAEMGRLSRELALRLEYPDPDQMLLAEALPRTEKVHDGEH